MCCKLKKIVNCVLGMLRQPRCVPPLFSWVRYAGVGSILLTAPLCVGPHILHTKPYKYNIMDSWVSTRCTTRTLLATQFRLSIAYALLSEYLGPHVRVLCEHHRLLRYKVLG